MDLDDYITQPELVIQDDPDFTRKEPQLIRDGWRNEVREMRYFGQCPGCRTDMFAFIDGDNDPRGMLGDNTADFIHPEEYGRDGALTVHAMCALCANDGDRYRRALASIKQKWDEEDAQLHGN